MIKLIWISDTDKRGIGYLILKKIFYAKDFYRLKGPETEEIIKREQADFLFMNLQRPANTDMMEMFCLRYINRLRVSVLTIKPFNSGIVKFFFPPEVIRTIFQNVFSSYKPSVLRRDL